MNTKKKLNPKAAVPLPIDIIQESLEFDSASETKLRWKRRPTSHFLTESSQKSWNTQHAGKPAGGQWCDRFGKMYFCVTINRKTYLCHRIVYFFVFGIDPTNMTIDHIDGNGQNNDPANLRLATRSQNQHNRGASKNNTSGFKGVYLEKKVNRWKSAICLNGKLRHIGLFDTKEEAHAAYVKAAEQLHGTFARTA